MKLRFPPMHKTQAIVARHPARYLVLDCGRRWGKTLLGGSLCVAVAAKGGRAWWIAPTYRMGDPGWRSIKGIAAQIPGAVIKRGERKVTINGGFVEVRSADDPELLKGDKLHFAVFDECAQIQESAWTASVRPMLADYQGRAMFISTPKGQNWFYRLYQLGQSGDNLDYMSWQLPTYSNPYIDKAEIDAARRDMPEAIFEQEYLAVFLIDQGVVFRNVQANMIAPADPDPADHKDHILVGGIDWGREVDFTATSVGCLTCKQELFRDRFNKVDYLLQSGRIVEIGNRWGVAGWLAESNSMGEPIIEALQDKGLPIVPFLTTGTSKPQLIRNLALSLERQDWQFQEDPTWTAELLMYEQKVSPVTGKSSYNAPVGLHDDTVIARALMLRAEDYVLYGKLFL